jgi:FixJ family two-component response regulator
MSALTRHIVIVDDEIALGQICQELLAGNGYKTSLYSRATDLLQNSEKGEIDLLITDVGLADKSGYDLAAEINSELKKSGKKEIPVIFISGGILPSIKNGNSYYLEKPFSIFALLKLVQAVFAAQNQEKQAG